MTQIPTDTRDKQKYSVGDWAAVRGRVGLFGKPKADWPLIVELHRRNILIRRAKRPRMLMD